jgi:hypothetical protein
MAGSLPPPRSRPTVLPVPDFADLHRQRQQHAHLTQQLLWEEYRQSNPDGYGYSRFCELYQRWRRKQDVVLRQEHKAGEKLFVDWAGTTIPIHDPRGGPVQQAHLFVAVLGASSYTYVEATADEQLASWTALTCGPSSFITASRTGLVPGWSETFWRSPGSRACCFSACAGSLTTQGRLAARDLNAARRVAFLLSGWSQRPIQ